MPLSSEPESSIPLMTNSILKITLGIHFDFIRREGRASFAKITLLFLKTHYKYKMIAKRNMNGANKDCIAVREAWEKISLPICTNPGSFGPEVAESPF